MAAIVTSRQNQDTPTNIGVEYITVDFNDATTATITPAKIKSILHYSVSPVNSTAGDASAVLYASAFSVGDPTIVLTSLINSVFEVKIEGIIA